METVSSADGTPIAFERTGNGPPLLLVHGITVDHTTWANVLPFLEKAVTVYAMDRRGRGESGDTDPYAFEREIEDIIAVIKSIEEPVHLFGHSFGALCVLEASRRTDRLRRLILYEPEVIPDPIVDIEQLLKAIRTAIKSDKREEALVTVYRDIVHLTTAELEAVRALSSWQRRVDAVHTAVRELETEHTYGFEPKRFQSMKTPTLLLVGEDSPPSMHQNATVLHQALPESRIEILENQQHVAYRMAPEAFAKHILSFATDEAAAGWEKDDDRPTDA